MSREKGGRGLRSIEEEYKVTKIKAAVKLYGNGDSAMHKHSGMSLYLQSTKKFEPTE